MPRFLQISRPWRLALLGVSLLLAIIVLGGREGVAPATDRQRRQTPVTPDASADEPPASTVLPVRTRNAEGVAPREAAATPPSTTATQRATREARVTASPAVASAEGTVTVDAVTPTPVYREHVVQSEETLIEIALAYQVSVEAIVEANTLTDPHLLQIGQQLRIPPALTPTAAPFADRDYGYEIIGYSWGGRAIEVFSFGDGPRHVVFVGGIHGGYEWNTVLLAHNIIDYFNGYRGDIPPGLTVNIIPVANPDGLFRVTGSAGRFDPGQIGGDTTPGRFNGRGVDLNRNWGCHWSSTAFWGPTMVDPGSGPFSEPETRALRAYLQRITPLSVVFWHSAAGLVSPGRCGDDNAQARNLANTYGTAAGYPVGPFEAYHVSGGASDWLVSQGIPTFSVELNEHHLTEFEKNVAGVAAVLRHYGPAEEE